MNENTYNNSFLSSILIHGKLLLNKAFLCLLMRFEVLDVLILILLLKGFSLWVTFLLISEMVSFWLIFLLLCQGSSWGWCSRFSSWGWSWFSLGNWLGSWSWLSLGNWLGSWGWCWFGLDNWLGSWGWLGLDSNWWLSWSYFLVFMQLINLILFFFFCSCLSPLFMHYRWSIFLFRIWFWCIFIIGSWWGWCGGWWWFGGW